MSSERVVSDWLRSAAPPRAPEALLSATLERVNTLAQDPLVVSRIRVVGGRRPAVRLLLFAAIVGAAAVGGSLISAGRLLNVHPSPPVPAVRLGALAYATAGGVFLKGTERDAPAAVELAANDPGGLGYWAPAWSPDGRYLMYEGTSSDASRIFVVDPQGRSVSSFPGWLASWSPDSTRIATWDQPFETVGIWSVDGRPLSTVPFPVGVTLPGDSTPVFTGDGSALYFVLSRMSSEPMAVPLDGSAPRQMSPITTAGNPVFSNDGSHLALPADDGLYVAEADGKTPRLIAHPAAGRYDDAIWSRADDRIAVAWAGTGAYESLAVIDVATGRTVIAWQAALGDLIHPLRWSPDGTSILAISGARLYRVVVNDQPTTSATFTAELLVEDAAGEGDLGADWQWVADGGR